MFASRAEFLFSNRHTKSSALIARVLLSVDILLANIVGIDPFIFTARPSQFDETVRKLVLRIILLTSGANQRNR